MALKEAERQRTGNYPNLDELGEHYGTTVLFRIVDLEDEDEAPNKGTYGWNLPLIVDVLALQRDENGEVAGHQMWLRWTMRFGSNTMWVLRGHAKPDKDLKRSEVLELAKTGTNRPGDEIIGHLVHKMNKQSPKGYFVAFNKASAGDKAAILKVREQLGGDNWGQDEDEAPF
jgi:hypothetical protein